MNKVLILLVVLILGGCSGLRSVGNNEAYVISPDGEKYTVGLKSDAKVTFKDKDGSEIEVDNRGREGIAESLVKLYGLKVITDD